MRRICLFLTDLEIGGTPTVVRELARRLHEPGRVHVHVVCLGREGPVAGQLKQMGVAVTALGAASAWQLGVVGDFRRLVEEQRFDVVMSFLVHANAVAAWVSSSLPGVQFVQSIQTTQPRPRWHWLVQGLAQSAAEAIVVPSASVAAVAMRRSDVPRERIVVIPNAVEVDRASREGRRNEPGRFVAGFLGRLDPVKRIDDLLLAVAGLDPDVGVAVVGSGPLRLALQERIARLGLVRRAVLREATSSPWEALAEFDCLVLPSEAEGFGLVLIEAMAAGLPVVATDAPGIRDVVTHEQTGLLVPVGDAVAMGRAIRRLADDAGLRRRLAEAGRADVAGRFTWEAVLPRYRAVLGIGELTGGKVGESSAPVTSTVGPTIVAAAGH